MAEQEERRAELTKLKRELLQLKAAALRPTEGSICIFESDIDMITLRELVNAGTDGDYTYSIGSRTVPLRASAKEIHAAIDGRGGGSDAMIQGTSRARREDIERYFNALKKKSTAAPCGGRIPQAPTYAKVDDGIAKEVQ